MPPVCLSFVRPTGDAIEWLALTAQPLPGFASVVGALVGAFAAARRMGRFRITTFATAATPCAISWARR